jgi:hypothetical protein
LNAGTVSIVALIFDVVTGRPHNTRYQQFEHQCFVLRLSLDQTEMFVALGSANETFSEWLLNGCNIRSIQAAYTAVFRDGNRNIDV